MSSCKMKRRWQEYAGNAGICTQTVRQKKLAWRLKQRLVALGVLDKVEKKDGK